MNEANEQPHFTLSGLLGSLVVAPIAAAIIAPLVFLLTLPLMLYRAWVLTILWSWFVVPAFGVYPLAIGYACGLLLILWLLQASVTFKQQQEDYSAAQLVQVFLGGFIGPTSSLGAGWIVKSLLCTQ